MKRSVPALLAMLLLALCLIPTTGCVIVRGGTQGTVVDAATGEAVEGLEVYYYLSRRSNWPGGEPFSLIKDVQVDRTNRFGDFSFAKNWQWVMPFVHKVEEERVIINMSLRSDVLIRSFANAEDTKYWLMPMYLSYPNTQYQGVIIDLHKAQPSERILTGAQVTGAASGKYVRMQANQQQLSQVKIPRQDGMGQ